MAWFSDGGPCNYFGVAKVTRLLAAGWLEADMEHPRGRVPFRDRSSLRRMGRLTQAFQPVLFMGGHHCSLCSVAAPYGYANLFLPDSAQVGKLWVAPELVAHYAAEHRYLPPVGFLLALRAALKMPGELYTAACNQLWAELSSGDPEAWPSEVPRDPHRARIEHQLLDLERGDVRVLENGLHVLAHLPEGDVSLEVQEGRVVIHPVQADACKINGHVRDSTLLVCDEDTFEIGDRRFRYAAVFHSPIRSR